VPQRLIYASGMDFTEVIKRRKMVRAFTGEPLAPGTADRLLKAAERAPSAGFSQGYSFLVLEGAEQCAPLWKILADAVGAGGGTADENPAEVPALSTAQLVIVPLACKDIYLDRYAQPDKGLTDRDVPRVIPAPRSRPRRYQIGQDTTWAYQRARPLRRDL